MTAALIKTRFSLLGLDEPFAVKAKAQVWYSKLGKHNFCKQGHRSATPGVVLAADLYCRYPEDKTVFIPEGLKTYRVNYEGFHRQQGRVNQGYVIVRSSENAEEAIVRAEAEIVKIGLMDDVRYLGVFYLSNENNQESQTDEQRKQHDPHLRTEAA
jgi:hypothetical protein